LIRPSTFSIVGYDPQEIAWGVAVASKFLAVGSVVPWARAGVGAIATQSYANTSFGPDGLEKMTRGLSAQETLDELLASDPEADKRQVGIVDQEGRGATFTGRSCFDWAGGITGDGFAAQGNILAATGVVQAMADAYQEGEGNLPRRLLKALQAGEDAGGDRRGKQSAAILVIKAGAGYGGFNDRWIDFRVDDHPDPVQRLSELLDLHDLYFGKSPAEDRIQLTGEALRKIQSIMSRLGYYHGPQHGEYDAATRTALEAFIGNENFEERMDFPSGQIDQPVYAYLTKHLGGGS
jgi:uncharacterized Ntn-hydrolase superfamily protein